MARRDDREYREYLREEQRRQPGSPPRVLCAVGWHPGSPPRVLCAVGWHPGCPARELCCEPRGQDTSWSCRFYSVLPGSAGFYWVRSVGSDGFAMDELAAPRTNPP